MSQFTVSEGQPGNWEEPDFFLCRLEAVRLQAYGWQEPCESRDSRTDLWERGGEIPLRHPTQKLLGIINSGSFTNILNLQFHPYY